MSEQIKNPQKCRFCNREVDFAYYCEECGISCCSDCLHKEKKIILKCEECGSKNIEQNHTEGNLKCKDCGSLQIFKINKKIESCPKCNSKEIVNVFEKKERLEKKFLDLIKKTRKITEPFEGIINDCDALRHRVQKARAPPIKCYHFPSIEPNLLKIFQFIIYLKENILEKINTHFRYIYNNIEYFFDIYNQPNSNIRIIEGILANLQKSFETIQSFITKKIEGISEKLDKIDKKLPFIQKVDDLFSSYKRFLNLAADEKPIFAIRTKLTNGLNDEDKFKRNKGILFITDMDLSFVRKYGLINKKYELIFKAPVNDLIKLKEEGTLFKKLIVEFTYGKYEFSISSESISTVVEYILLAKNFDERVRFDNIAAKNLLGLSLDVNNLMSYIEEGINNFFSLKCQFNQKNKPPIIRNNNETPQREHHQSHLSQNASPNRIRKDPSIRQSTDHHSENNQFSSFPTNFPQQEDIQKNPAYNSQIKPNNNQDYQNQIHQNPRYPNSYNHQNPQVNATMKVNSNFQGYHSPHQHQHQHTSSHSPPCYPSRENRFHQPEKNHQPNNSCNPYHLHNSPEYSKSEAYYEDPHHPKRFQNYKPFNNSEEFSNIDDSQNYFDERSILMRKLRKANASNNGKSTPFSESTPDIPMGNSGINGFNKNHLAPEFEFQKPNRFQPNPREYNFNPQEQMREKTLLLRKQRHEKMNVLKNLNQKYENGNISRNEYHRHYNKIKRQLYLIDKKLQNLSNSLDSDSSKDKEYFS